MTVLIIVPCAYSLSHLTIIQCNAKTLYIALFLFVLFVVFETFCFFCENEQLFLFVPHLPQPFLLSYYASAHISFSLIDIPLMTNNRYNCSTRNDDLHIQHVYIFLMQFLLMDLSPCPGNNVVFTGLGICLHVVPIWP